MHVNGSRGIEEPSCDPKVLFEPLVIDKIALLFLLIICDDKLIVSGRFDWLRVGPGFMVIEVDE